ncbi:hypothetical protein Pla108_24900 [Botrimarina colliarenosi]|uniref:Uncharacterized protein n=1 Tax=Botrimarina colliarenosi TaxID=2528001 RepID=A0A5C6AB92_9BACT|nr:hypothetical protein [Botrimarina colliarenosi]TWT96716.1 hypothetical protein Pla108_24900 [Botrimarina colliarenosi]
MPPRQLVEIAGLLSLRSGPLLKSKAAVCSDTLSEYWIASRCRLDEWGRLLRTLGHSRSAPPADEAGGLLIRLVEEVTLSELLARIVAAICAADDLRRTGEEAGPIGQNTLDGHREASSRLRALVFAWWPADSPRSRHARSLTKQTERWTDVLLAYVGVTADVERFAIDPSRLREFAYDVQSHGAESSQAASQLLAFGLRDGFAAATQAPLNGDLNRRIAGAALALFGPAGFDGHGLQRPPWMLRAERTADDTIALVDRLFEDDDTPLGMRLPQRWRI